MTLVGSDLAGSDLTMERSDPNSCYPFVWANKWNKKIGETKY